MPSSNFSAELDQQLREADALKFGDPHRLLLVAQRAGGLAQDAGDFRRFAQALNHQAWAHLNMHRYEPSLTYAMEVMLLARAHGFADIEARAVNILGLNFFRCGIAYEAARLYEYQLELGKHLDDGELQAMALHDWALVKMSEGDPDGDAIQMMRQAVELMPASAYDGLNLSVIHSNLSWCYIRAGKLDEAQAHLEQALALAQQAKSLNVAGNAHLNLASVHLARGDTQAASAQIDDARACVVSDEPDILSVNVSLLTTELLTTEGRHREAMPSWERTYELAVGAGMTEFAERILHAMKDAYEQLGDEAGVISVYKRLTEDVPRVQQQGDALRFSVLRMVFANDKAALEADLRLAKQKGAILERLSHEFRTPLAIIQNATEQVEHGGETMTIEQRRTHLQQISEHVRAMTATLEDIVALLQLDDAVEGAR